MNLPLSRFSFRKIISSALFFALLIFSSCNSKPADEKADTLVKKKMSRHEMDSIAKHDKDSLRMEALKKTATFPLINAGDGSGVLPVEGVDEIPDPNREYKLLFEFSEKNGDTTHKKVNEGLLEIARIWNLHVASGIPLSHIHVVIVTHGGALFSLMNEEAYKKKYKKENPDNKLVGELMNNRAKIIACGQAMQFGELKKEDLREGVKVALTAQVVKSNYLGQGYSLYQIEDDN